jgi:hypothetical protein
MLGSVQNALSTGIHILQNYQWGILAQNSEYLHQFGLFLPGSERRMSCCDKRYRRDTDGLCV